MAQIKKNRPVDGVKYYSYLLCYVDDVLCIHHNVFSVLEWLHKSFPLKPRFGNPDLYLDAMLHMTSCIMEHGQCVPLSMFERQSETVQCIYHPFM